MEFERVFGLFGGTWVFYGSQGSSFEVVTIVCRLGKWGLGADGLTIFRFPVEGGHLRNNEHFRGSFFRALEALFGGFVSV